MSKFSVNPILPSYEYIPDGEPYVFGDRVYIYGSHDAAHGWVFCQNDYVCWSAHVDDLANWRYEGVIYTKTQDPVNPDGHACLYAPDITIGPDGRYYLYYNLDKTPIVSVAVADGPVGPFEFYGHVKYECGTLYGEHEQDEPQFDPDVITEGDKTYLYTGFCLPGDKSRTGAMSVVLGPDMITITCDPVFVLPGPEADPNDPRFADFNGEGFEFFEGPSIRKVGDMYYLIYSTKQMHELAYATSDNPRSGFKFGGVIVSNADVGIDTYKPADKKVNFAANNHGSIVEIKGQWYIFYHRHTHGTWFSRQACAQPIEILADGSIPQVEVTSMGLLGVPLPTKGHTHSTHIACILYNDNPEANVQPKVYQDGRDGSEECSAHIASISDGSVIGFKYFDFKDVKKMTITTRGYASGYFEVRQSVDGPVLGTINAQNRNVWTEESAEIDFADGVHPLFLKFHGKYGNAPSIGEMRFE